MRKTNVRNELEIVRQQMCLEHSDFKNEFDDRNGNEPESCAVGSGCRRHNINDDKRNSEKYCTVEPHVLSHN